MPNEFGCGQLRAIVALLPSDGFGEEQIWLKTSTGKGAVQETRQNEKELGTYGTQSIYPRSDRQP